MNLQTTKHPYRLLLQINDDGSIGSSISFKLKTVDIDTGDVISVTELPVTDLDADGGEWDLDNVLGEVLAKSVSAVEKLKVDLTNAQQSVAHMQPVTAQSVVADGVLVISNFQMHMALAKRGLYDAVLDVIASLPETMHHEAFVLFHKTPVAYSDNPLVMQILAAIGLDADGQRELFEFALTL